MIFFAKGIAKRSLNVYGMPYEEITTVDDNGYNFIANLERNYNEKDEDGKPRIIYDPETKLIKNILPTESDVGYGLDKQNTGGQLEEVTAERALELLKEYSNQCAKSIINVFGPILNRYQFNAMVSLRYNIGNLSNVEGLVEALKEGNYNRNHFYTLIENYYRGLSSVNTYIDGWLKRLNYTLDLFFDKKYMIFYIDAVNYKIVEEGFDVNE